MQWAIKDTATKLCPQAHYFHFEVLFSMLKNVFQLCVINSSFFMIVVFFVKDIPQTASLF